MPTRIALIADHDPDFEPHPQTEAAVEHAAAALGITVESTWVPTDALDGHAAEVLAGFDALFVGPGSPYRSKDGVLEALAHARTLDMPVLGTCAGFQHIVLEFARTILGHAAAESAEYDAGAEDLLISELACSPAGQVMDVGLERGSRIATIHGGLHTRERYYCRFGLDPLREPELQAAGLRITGRDQDGSARVVESTLQTFRIGTLYVPQARSRSGAPHKLVLAFVGAAAEARSAADTQA